MEDYYSLGSMLLPTVESYVSINIISVSANECKGYIIATAASNL